MRVRVNYIPDKPAQTNSVCTALTEDPSAMCLVESTKTHVLLCREPILIAARPQGETTQEVQNNRDQVNVMIIF